MTHEERLRLVASLVKEIQPKTDKQWERLAAHVPRLIDPVLPVSTEYVKVLWNIAQREGVSNA